MPDLDLMPPGQVLEAAPRPPAGIADVLARATRRRRRQRTGALAAGAAACAAVLAVSMTSGSAIDSLGVTPAHPGDQRVPGVTAPERGDTPALPDQVAPAAAGEPAAVAADGAVSSSDDITDGTETTTTGTATGNQTGKAAGEIGPPHTVVPYDPSHGCGANGPTIASGWCSYYDGATAASGGQRVELAQALCRAPGQGAATIDSDDGQQAEFTIFGKDAYRKWTWSKGHRFSKRATSLEVPAGSCVRWHVSWRVVDDVGKPLPRGSYDLDARSMMSAPGSTYLGAQAQFVTFTVL